MCQRSGTFTEDRLLSKYGRLRRLQPSSTSLPRLARFPSVFTTQLRPEWNGLQSIFVNIHLKFLIVSPPSCWCQTGCWMKLLVVLFNWAKRSEAFKSAIRVLGNYLHLCCCLGCETTLTSQRKKLNQLETFSCSELWRQHDSPSSTKGYLKWAYCERSYTMLTFASFNQEVQVRNFKVKSCLSIHAQLLLYLSQDFIRRFLF